MSYTVLTRITSQEYPGQKFYIHKYDDEISMLTEVEARTVADIFNDYPDVFSEIEVLPRENEEIRLLNNFWDENGNKLDFEVEMVADECAGLIDRLSASLEYRIGGLSHEYTRNVIFSDDDDQIEA